MKYNILDLFCGAGGLSLGFEKAGFSLIEEGNLFDESLNDRQETVQRYFVLKR